MAGICGQPGLHNVFQAYLNYTVRLQKTKPKNKQHFRRLLDTNRRIVAGQQGKYLFMLTVRDKYTNCVKAMNWYELAVRLVVFG